MLEPLLRSTGNMAASSAAAKILGASAVTSVIQDLQQCPMLKAEASWALSNLDAATSQLPACVAVDKT
jgi:hypothetical protein